MPTLFRITVVAIHNVAFLAAVDLGATDERTCVCFRSGREALTVCHIHTWEELHMDTVGKARIGFVVEASPS